VKGFPMLTNLPKLMPLRTLRTLAFYCVHLVTTRTKTPSDHRVESVVNTIGMNRPKRPKRQPVRRAPSDHRGVGGVSFWERKAGNRMGQRVNN
jgi:hypothetical protein